MTIRKINWMAVAVTLLWFACTKNDTSPQVKDKFSGFVKPANFPEPRYHFNTNPVTEDGFKLGRKLFFDPILSSNNTISCASCHIPTSAFTHHGHAVSHGIFDRLGTRNSQPVMNLAWSSSFMWDGGIFDLDLQPISPIRNHVEMDNAVQNVLMRLQSNDAYPAMFAKAFGDTAVTTARFLKALSQFMLMCVSSNAKYDSVKLGMVTFTADEQKGYAIFKKQCASCHAEPLFTDNSFQSNGLMPSLLDDRGRFNVTLHDSDLYKFKVPSLRNLRFTQPYMHDGRLLTLNAVLEHYSAFLEVNFAEEEKKQLLDFLNSLNDERFVRNPLLSE